MTPAPTVDETIEQVEKLYESLTGHEMPTLEQSYAQIPPEADPQRYVEERMSELIALVKQRPAPIITAIDVRPPMSIHQADGQLVIEVDLPGVDRDAVGVTLHEGILTINGVRTTPSVLGASHTQIVQSETPYGRFQRSVVLPRGVTPDLIDAALTSGVLRISIERPEGAREQSIPVTQR